MGTARGASGSPPAKAGVIIGVVNPASGMGHSRDRVLEQVCAELGKPLELIRTAGPGDVTRAAAGAAAKHPEALVLVGGDGSVGELCRAYADIAADDRPPLVLVPAGRGNSFYKALLSDAPWEDYLRRAIDRPYVRRVDIGRVVETGDTWALGFSLGYLHDCVASTRYFPGLRGRTLYAAAGTYAAARLRPFKAEVTVDGRAVFAGRAVMVAVGGGPYRGGRLQLFPTADLTDGLLDLAVVEAVSPRRFAEILRAGSKGTHVEMREVHTFQGAEVRISSPDPMRCELDGTIYASEADALTLRCLPEFLPVAFPLWHWDDVPR